jgi:hypothetical protein
MNIIAYEQAMVRTMFFERVVGEAEGVKIDGILYEVT